jgi:hypothetical protein
MVLAVAPYRSALLARGSLEPIGGVGLNAFGSYGPAAATVDAAGACAADFVAPSGLVGDNFEFGVETSLSANPFSVGGGDADKGLAAAASGIATEGGTLGGDSGAEVKPVAPAVGVDAARAVVGAEPVGVTPAMAMADGAD